MTATATAASLADLAALACRPLKGSEHLLPAGEVERLLGLLPDWSLSADGRMIRREYRFRQYFETMAFVNAVAWIAHREDHHPDLEVGYARCLVGLSTHDVGGLSINDFIVAAKIEGLGTLR
jgi:4a-hydroxytetrahydrobiopterin dehydratase